MTQPRTEWIGILQPGDPVWFHSPTGIKPARFLRFDRTGFWIEWETRGGVDVHSFLTLADRTDGTLPYITPYDEGILPAIGADPDRPDHPVGGWEAA